jgi:hypothetical protein
VPIIIVWSSGAGATLRLFSPEHMGGFGDFGATIDAEVARTGLSSDEIGPKVRVFVYQVSIRTSQHCIPRYFTIQKESSFKFLAFLQCMTTRTSRRRYDVFELIKLIFNESMSVQLLLIGPVHHTTRNGYK